MPRNFFITGMPKSGKTTVLWELIEELKRNGLKVGGIISPSEKHHGTRTGFHIIDIRTGKEGLLADVHGDGPKVSKYHVDIRSFERVAIPAMEKCSECDVFIIDEIGRMEMKSRKFVRMLDHVLDSETPLIASLGSNYSRKFGALGEILRVTPRNRGAIYKRLLDEALKELKKPKKKARKKKEAAKKKAVKKKARKRAVKRKERKPKKKKPPEEIEERKPKIELEEEEEEEKGFFGKVRDLLGF